MANKNDDMDLFFYSDDDEMKELDSLKDEIANENNKNNKVKKNKFLKTKAGKVVLGATIGAIIVGASGFAITKTDTYKKIKTAYTYEYDRVDAFPIAPEGYSLTYANGKLVAARTEHNDNIYYAVEYLERDGYEIVKDPLTKIYWYEKDGVKVEEAIPVVPNGTNLVWTDDGYMAQVIGKQVVFSNDITYVVPDGYTLMQDEDGNYYGVKVKSNIDEKQKIKK